MAQKKIIITFTDELEDEERVNASLKDFFDKFSLFPHTVCFSDGSTVEVKIQYDE